MVAPQSVNLPNGQTLTVIPVFGGYTFKSSQLDLHHSAFPPGWTVNLQTQDEVDETDERLRRRAKISSYRDPSDDSSTKHTVTHRFIKPTLQGDSLYLSSISIPSSSDFKMSSSPTRQIALMLWSTLWWYFHKEAPNPHVVTEASSATPMAGRPKADWRIRIKREGILKGRNLMQKLERMGLVASEESCVGTDVNVRNPAGWNEMFVSRRSFWQIDARIFLFTLPPANQSPFPSASPFASRPGSPVRDGQSSPSTEMGASHPEGINAVIVSTGGPFSSGSHLPTYYPPAPTQYIFTNHIRHPIRPKPPGQGETFYTRYIPSVEQYISFRVPSLSRKISPPFSPIDATGLPVLPPHTGAAVAMSLPTLAGFAERSSDVDILHRWMNEPRVNAAWGCAGPVCTQQKFLEDGLSSMHSFPVIGCWDGKPFGYFEIYWVKEDKLGRLLGGQVGNYARGLHVLVGEQEFRGPHRVKIWLDALVHYCWLADPRTETVMMEPRIDNHKYGCFHSGYKI